MALEKQSLDAVSCQRLCAFHKMEHGSNETAAKMDKYTLQSSTVKWSAN